MVRVENYYDGGNEISPMARVLHTFMAREANKVPEK
jgi:hypothetical protein